MPMERCECSLEQTRSGTNSSRGQICLICFGLACSDAPAASRNARYSPDMKPAAWVTAAALIPLVGATASPVGPDGDATSRALHQLFADEQAFTWKEHPLTASFEGQRTYDDRLESDLPGDFE